MANDEHVALLKQGMDAWNAWRHENRCIRPDLSGAILDRANLRGGHLGGADLGGAHLRSADLRWADFSGANLGKAFLGNVDLGGANLSGANLRSSDLGRANLGSSDLRRADFSGAHLSGADLSCANLSCANLSGADLSSADLSEANLIWANLHNAVLIEAHLHFARLVGNDFTGADLTGCRVHGVSAWGLRLDSTTKQQNLVITRPDEPEITVDNIEVAQFVYLLLHNEKIRDVIDTVGKKGVLLLGRFTQGRIEILERLREKLRSLGYVPMVFNFDKPETKDFTETVRLLCSLSKFVIVDITNPRSAPLELQATVPDTMVPFAPILQNGEDPFAMFVDLKNKYDWVLKDVIVYPSVDRLVEVLEREIVGPAEAKFSELLLRRTEQLRLKTV